MLLEHSKYTEIYFDVWNDEMTYTTIHSGKASRSVTLRDVAAKAQVSIATVSHVVNNTRTVKAHTRKRVEQAIDELSYHRNDIARELKTGSSGLVGVLIVDYNPFYTDVLRGIEEAVEPLGWKFVVASTGENWEKQKELLHVMISRRMQGILIATVDGFDSQYVESVTPADIPIVLFDRHVPGNSLVSVTSMNYEGSRQAVEHFHQHGYQNIGFVLGKDKISSFQDRKIGFEDTSKRLNLSTRIEEDAPNIEGGYEAGRRLFSKINHRFVPEAVLVGNNMMLIGFLEFLRDHQLRVGVDVAVISFDYQPWCDVVNPPLTVIRQSSRQMGIEAVTILKSKIDGELPVDVRLPVELSIGGSCGCMQKINRSKSQF